MKVLIIGLGSIARKHLVALQSLSEPTQCYALRSRADAAPLAGLQNVYSYTEAAALDPDWVLISNPTALHRATIEKVLPWGKPLFIEKPALDSLADTDLLLQRSEAVLTYVACNLRFLEGLQFLRKYLKGRNIQEAQIYCGSYLPEWRPGTDFRQSYSARPELGGGVHLDLIHELDYAYWLFGAPERHTATLRSRSTLDIPAVDYAHYVLCYPRFVATVTLNYFRRDYRRHLELVLEDETLVFDLATNQVRTAGGVVLFRSEQTIADTYLPQLRYFTQLVRDQATTSMNSLREGLEVLKMVSHEYIDG